MEAGRTARRVQAIRTRLFGSNHPSRGSKGTERFFDVEPRVPYVAQPALRIFLEATVEQSCDARRRLCRQSAPVGLTVENRHDRVGGRVASECRPGSQHLVQHAAERPDVRPLVDGLASSLFRTHIGGRARDHTFSCLNGCSRRRLRYVVSRFFRRKYLREPEVEHLYSALRCDLDVRRFQIAVDDAFLMSGFERVGDLTRDGKCFLNRQRTRRQTLGKRRALHEFEYEAADAVRLLQSVDGADVWMVQRCQHPRLELEPLEPAWD